MANSNKTKAEILQELESIKGLLLEEDDIPILQVIDETLHADIFHPPQQQTTAVAASSTTANPSVLPGQTSLFADEPEPEFIQVESSESANHNNPPSIGSRQGFAAHLSNLASHQNAQAQTNLPRPLVKASGENPFLPQHIRERLHGNNPPPLFEYETAKKILNATKNIANKINKPRQTLVDDVVNSLMPSIEVELRHRLFAMSEEDLKKLLNEDEE